MHRRYVCLLVRHGPGRYDHLRDDERHPRACSWSRGEAALRSHLTRPDTGQGEVDPRALRTVARRKGGAVDDQRAHGRLRRGTRGRPRIRKLVRALRGARQPRRLRHEPGWGRRRSRVAAAILVHTTKGMPTRGALRLLLLGNTHGMRAAVVNHRAKNSSLLPLHVVIGDDGHSGVRIGKRGSGGAYARVGGPTRKGDAYFSSDTAAMFKCGRRPEGNASRGPRGLVMRTWQSSGSLTWE